MSKFITGMLVGIIVTLVLVVAIYPNINTDIWSGNFWHDALLVLNNWWVSLQEAVLHNGQY